MLTLTVELYSQKRVGKAGGKKLVCLQAYKDLSTSTYKDNYLNTHVISYLFNLNKVPYSLKMAYCGFMVLGA